MREHTDLLIKKLSEPGPANPALALSSDEWHRLQRQVIRFEEAWRLGTRPDLRDYLPEDGEEAEAVLIELVYTEIEFRRREGETVHIEEYRARFPELAMEGKLAFDHLSSRSWPVLKAEGSCSHDNAQDPGALPEKQAVDVSLLAEASRRLGRYELRKLVGHGSFGMVYRAWDTELGRTVALKVPRSGREATAQEIERFLHEARSAAKLRHRHIVSVFDAGQMDGTCYLASEFVEGMTLADRVAASGLPIRAAVELVARVAGALHHAHQNGVIHRDLKPSNILIDEEGQPRLTDFGLAKLVSGEATLTTDGRVLGTPAYMSPEQARGDGGRIDARTDVYSLGVVLYELLTGEPPFRGNHRMLMVQLLESDPRPPRTLNDAIPRDLETICLKAMAKEPAHRYPTAAALADDLERFLGGVPVHARPVGRLVRLARKCRRKPLTAALCASLLVSVVVGMAGMMWQWRRAESHLADAQEQRRRLLQSLHEANLTLNTLLTLSPKTLASPREESLSARARAEVLIERFERYAGLIGQSSEALHESAMTYEQAGNFLRAMGYRDLAAREWHKAASQLETFIQQYPDHSFAQFNLAALYRKLGGLAREEDRLDERRRYSLKALELLATIQADAEERLRKQPGDRRTSHELVRIYDLSALLLYDTGQEAGAARAYHRSRAILDRLIAEPEFEDSLLTTLANHSSQLGRLHRAGGDLGTAISEHQRSIALWERYCRKHPEDVKSRNFWAQECCHLGEECREANRLDESLVAFRQGRDLWTELLKENPAESRSWLSKVHRHIAALLDRQGKYAEALEEFRRSTACYEAMIAAEPEVPDHRRGLATAIHCAGNMLVDLGRLEEAVQEYQRALTTREAICARSEENLDDVANFAGTCHNMAEIQEMLGRLSEAKALFERAVEKSRFVDQKRKTERSRSILDDNLAGLARVTEKLTASAGP